MHKQKNQFSNIFQRPVGFVRAFGACGDTVSNRGDYDQIELDKFTQFSASIFNQCKSVQTSRVSIDQK